jgi:putative solute:sodium symporter small subunit
VKPFVFIPHREIQARPRVSTETAKCDDDLMSHVTLTDEEFRRRVNTLRLSLLAVWASVTFCVAFFARDLDFVLFERPVGFWMAAQGSVLVFLAITWAYALLVNRWEKQTPSQRASEQGD